MEAGKGEKEEGRRERGESKVEVQCTLHRFENEPVV